MRFMWFSSTLFGISHLEAQKAIVTFTFLGVCLPGWTELIAAQQGNGVGCIGKGSVGDVYWVFQTENTENTGGYWLEKIIMDN